MAKFTILIYNNLNTLLENFIDQLNDAQRAPVLHKDGQLMVIAGAGSGKTRVLTFRIAHLMEQGVDAFNILALTTAYHNLKGLYPKGTIKKISDYNYLFGDIKKDVLYWGNKFLDDNYNDKGVVTKN